jgi:hypothetical protein
MKKIIHITMSDKTRVFYTNTSGTVVLKSINEDGREVTKKYSVTEFMQLLGLDEQPEREKKYPSHPHLFIP